LSVEAWLVERLGGKLDCDVLDDWYYMFGEKYFAYLPLENTHHFMDYINMNGLLQEEVSESMMWVCRRALNAGVREKKMLFFIHPDRYKSLEMKRRCHELMIIFNQK
jgi:hypothetical protein